MPTWSTVVRHARWFFGKILEVVQDVFEVLLLVTLIAFCAAAHASLLLARLYSRRTGRASVFAISVFVVQEFFRAYGQQNMQVAVGPRPDAVDAPDVDGGHSYDGNGYAGVIPPTSPKIAS